IALAEAQAAADVKAAAADLAAQAAELVLSKRAESGGVDPLVERAIPEISKRLQ
ncbi:ATP F0F1 synthase subunit B, partial [Pseudomonas sp. GP01-A4]